MEYNDKIIEMDIFYTQYSKEEYTIWFDMLEIHKMHQAPIKSASKLF